MQHLSRSELSAMRDNLRLADVYLARARGICITAGYAAGAAAINALISRIAHHIARINKALMTKP